MCSEGAATMLMAKQCPDEGPPGSPRYTALSSIMEEGWESNVENFSKKLTQRKRKIQGRNCSTSLPKMRF